MMAEITLISLCDLQCELTPDGIIHTERAGLFRLVADIILQERSKLIY